MISVAVAMTMMSTLSYAAGLGKLKLSSSLGEPLIAEIELLTVTPDELASLTAEIASPAAYEAQSIERTAAASLVRVQAGKRSDGTPVLKLSSLQPILDPFLDMLVQVDWSSGRILREYTILLDPPSEITAISKSKITLPEINNSSVVTQYGNTATIVNPTYHKKSLKRNRKLNADQEKLAAAKAEAADADKPIEQPLEQSVAKLNKVENLAASEIKTRRGDTLSKIARENMSQGVNLDQMLIALYKANKDAFVRGNINRLKVGQIIRVPAQSNIEATSKKDAHAAVIAQTQDWNAYRNNLAGEIADAPVKEDSNSSQASTGRITTAVDQSAKPVAPSQDVVKLSKNDTSIKNGKTNTKQSADAKAENNIAASNAIKELQIKTQMLDSNIKEMKALKELIELKNKKLAEQQNVAKLAEVTKPVDAAKPLEAPKTNQTATPLPAVKSADASNSVQETKKEIVRPVEVLNPKIEGVATVPKTSLKNGPLESILNNENTPIFGLFAGVITLLGLGWLFMRNKRKKNITGFEHGILTGGGLKGNTVFGGTGGATVDTGDTSFLTDFTNNQGGIIDANEVDPIAEAEVYMAYGRENQAEEILKDAIVKEPTRYELHLKLLEILSSRNDSSGFEAIAGELYTALGTDDPVWKKVATMGSMMEPNNPLYKMSESESAFEPQFNSSSKNEIESDFDKTQNLASNNFDLSSSDDISDLIGDHKLDFDYGDKESVAQKNSDNLNFKKASELQTSFGDDPVSDLDLSFDMPNMDLVKPNTGTENNLSGNISELNSFENMDSAIDFKFDEVKDLENFSSMNSEIIPSLPKLDLDIEPSEMPVADKIEVSEVNTKLDLVAMYIEMGDKEGAKELIDEVLKEGSSLQKAKAQALLNEIA